MFRSKSILIFELDPLDFIAFERIFIYNKKAIEKLYNIRDGGNG
jgi:hypothetical protein